MLFQVAVATASWSSCEGTLRVHYSYLPSSILMVLCHFICLLSFILTDRLVRSKHHLRNYWKLHGSTWNLLVNAHFAMLLLLFGICFQTAFAMFPHSRLSNISSRPICFVKLFPIHSSSYFRFCFSCFHIWRFEFFKDFAPYKNSLYYYYFNSVVATEYP